MFSLGLVFNPFMGYKTTHRLLREHSYSFDYQKGGRKVKLQQNAKH